MFLDTSLLFLCVGTDAREVRPYTFLRFYRFIFFTVLPFYLLKALLPFYFFTFFTF